jgi:hypothetical protein
LVANTYRSELASDILKKASKYVQHYINTGAWREVKLLLRFLGCLQLIFEGDGIFPILEELFARAVDLQTASSEDVSVNDLLPSICASTDQSYVVARLGTRQNNSLHYPVHNGIPDNWLRSSGNCSS